MRAVVIYTPAEATKTLIREYRNPKRASEDFICSWFINRNEQMEWVSHSGQVKNDPVMRICIMTGHGEPVPAEAIEVLCQLLARLFEGQPDPWQIQFGNTPKSQENSSGRYLSKEMRRAKPRILQNLKLMKVSLVTL